MNQKHFTDKDSSVLISVMPVQRGNTVGVQVETRGDWNATAKRMQSAGFRMVNIDRSDNPNLINTGMA